MTGNPKLSEMGFKEEAMGHNAIAGGFQASVSGPISVRTVTFRRRY